jgi:hypothetical protein
LRRELELYACIRQKIPFVDSPNKSYWEPPFELQLLDSIQKAIDDEAQRKYQGCEELIISIYVRATVTSQDDLVDILRKVTVPPRGPSTRVFAFCRTRDHGPIETRVVAGSHRATPPRNIGQHILPAPDEARSRRVLPLPGRNRRCPWTKWLRKIIFAENGGRSGNSRTRQLRDFSSISLNSLR